MLILSVLIMLELQKKISLFLIMHAEVIRGEISCIFN